MSKIELAQGAVGHKYKSRFGDGASLPYLDTDDALQKRMTENRWKRWDGVEGSIEEHGDWIYQEIRSLVSPERQAEWRSYGSKSGCKYFIHDELTRASGGTALLRIEATLKLEPRDMVAWMFDMPGLRDADETIVVMKVLKEYQAKEEGGPFHAAVYWANAPGFPFAIRDGIDISTYRKDTEGAVWQVSCSAPSDFASMPGAVRAIDRYWGYKLVANGDGTTTATLLCQSVLNGYMPRFIQNPMTARVLIDYLSTVEAEVAKAKTSGKQADLLAKMQLSSL